MKLRQALLHNTGWKMLAMVFTFLNNIVIVRILGAEASGVFFYAIAIFILLSTVFKLGLENGIVYTLTKNVQATKTIASFLLLISLFQAFITVLVLKFFVKEIAEFNFYWVVLFVLSNIFIYYVNAFYQVKKMFISLNVISFVIVILQTLVLSVLYFNSQNFLIDLGIAKSNIDSILIISGVAVLFQVILLISFFYKQNAADFNILNNENGYLNKLINYSFLNFIITVLFFLTLRVDLYFVEKYCTTIELSNYLQAGKIGQMLLIIPGLIAGVIFPYTINEPSILKSKVAYLCRILTFVYLIVFIGFLLFGKMLFLWLLGSEFYLMHKIFALSFFGFYCLSISLLLVSYFEGISKQSIIIISFLATVTIMFLANYLCVPLYGYASAAITFSIANFIGLIILFRSYSKETAISFREVFITRPSDLKLK